MATFKAEVQNKRADGTYNVRIRVTHNRQIRRISTNVYVTSDDLTKSLKIKNEDVIKQCNVILKKCREACNVFGYSIAALGIDELVEKIKVYLIEKDKKFKLDFLEYTRTKIQEMPNWKYR